MMKTMIYSYVIFVINAQTQSSHELTRNNPNPFLPVRAASPQPALDRPPPAIPAIPTTQCPYPWTRRRAKHKKMNLCFSQLRQSQLQPKLRVCDAISPDGLQHTEPNTRLKSQQLGTPDCQAVLTGAVTPSASNTPALHALSRIAGQATPAAVW